MPCPQTEILASPLLCTIMTDEDTNENANDNVINDTRES